MNAALQALRSRWVALAPREQALSAGARAVVAIAILWWVALGPAITTLRSAETQHRALDEQLQRMRGLQAQAQSLQSQPIQNRDESQRALEASLRERLGTTARLAVAGNRATVTVAGAAPDVLAQWLTQARVNAHALPAEAHLTRNASGQWDGTLVLTLPG